MTVMHEQKGTTELMLRVENSIAGIDAEAIEIFKQLAVLKPGNASAPNNMGEAYLELGKLNEAMEAFKQAIRLKPDSGRAYFNLGKCYLAMGNRNAAVEQYNILQNIDPDWAEKLDQLINP